MWSMLQGKKIHIMAVVSGILGILQGDPLNVMIPEWIWWIDGMLFTGAVRSMLAKMEK